MFKSKKREGEKLLKNAENHIFSMGLNDSASMLCRENMKYGLAKMHYVQNSLGLEPDATFISSPDETVTRNSNRWDEGISYGGKITWGNGKEKLVMLDVKPNTCGMLVGGINKVPKPIELIRKIFAMERKKSFIDGIPLSWDFYNGNHFIDVFRATSLDSRIKVPKHVVILHAGCPELKGDNPKGTGLYWNMSKELQKIMKTVKTPFGDCRILTEGDADEYFKFYKYAENFAKERRKIAFNKLFGGGKILLNKCHQGLVHINEAKLGCHHIKDEKELIPISIRADLPSYLCRGKFNLEDEKIEELGFMERAHDLGIYSRLRKVNIMPHGGGYFLPQTLNVTQIFSIQNKRYFEIESMNGMGRQIYSSPKELEFSYRSREVVMRTEQLGLAEKKAELIPLYTLKI